MNVGRTTGTGAEEASLVSLVVRNAVPGFQYMDAATLAWVASHSNDFPLPSSMPGSRVGAIAQRILHAPPIPSDCHPGPKLDNSFHGTRHMLATASPASPLLPRLGLCT